MSQYRIIKKYDSRLYCDNSPITIEKYAFLYDSIKGLNMIQLKMRNISNKCISNIELGFQILDIQGNIVEEFNHKFVAINAKTDSIFGEQESIYLKGMNINDVKFAINRVNYDDGTGEVYKSTFFPIEFPREISSLNEYQDAYIKVIKENTHCQEVKNIATVYSDIWYCSCGNIQKKDDEICRCCGGNVNKIQQYAELEFLKRKSEEIKQEKKAAKEKKRKNIIKSVKIIMAIICVIILFIIGKFIYHTVCRQIDLYNRYQEAEDAVNTHHYKKAKKILSELGDYKNAKERKKEIDKLEENYKNELAYEQAKDLIKKKEYEEAISALKEIVNYSNARELITDCYYKWGKELASNKQYVDAIKKLNSIEQYADTEEQLKRIKYEYACECVEKKHYEDAINLYKELDEDNYKDCKELLSNTYYQAGCMEEVRKKYDKALEYFGNVNGNDKGLACEKIEECKMLQMEQEKEDNYNMAMEYAASGGFENAVRILEELPDDYKETSLLQEKFVELNNDKWKGVWSNDESSIKIDPLYKNEKVVYSVQYEGYTFDDCVESGNSIVLYSADDNINTTISYKFGNKGKQENKGKKENVGSGTSTSINLDQFWSMKKISISLISNTQLQIEKIISKTDIVYKKSKMEKEIEIFTKN